MDIVLRTAGLSHFRGKGSAPTILGLGFQAPTKAISITAGDYGSSQTLIRRIFFSTSKLRKCKDHRYTHYAIDSTTTRYASPAFFTVTTISHTSPRSPRTMLSRSARCCARRIPNARVSPSSSIHTQARLPASSNPSTTPALRSIARSTTPIRSARPLGFIVPSRWYSEAASQTEQQKQGESAAGGTGGGEAAEAKKEEESDPVKKELEAKKKGGGGF